MKKRMLSFLLSLSILLGVGGPAAAVDTGYSDVAEDAYYAGAVDYCREQGLMNGTSATTFSPDMTTSRAQLTAILWRQAGSPAAGAAPFPDVPAGAYYATAAAWASGEGIVSGYSDGRFAPDDPITRAQLVTLLWRSSGRPATANQSTFADHGDIPSYAAAAAAWAQHNGIVGGKSGNRFDPDGNATRAQTATILYRYLTMDGQADPPTEPDTPTPSNRDILVAYFSATGTTQAIAEYIAADLDADLHKITPAVPYTSDDLNYTTTNTRAEREQNNPAARPEISGFVAGMDQYDTIFVGYPIWWGQAPKIIYTFLENYDLSGKTIVPFCTSSSSGIGSSAANLHPLAPSAVWQDGGRFAGGANHSAVTGWLNTLHFNGRQEESTAMPKLTIQVGDQNFTATLEESETTRTLLSRLPLTVTMKEMNGNEKFYYLPASLPTQSRQPGTIRTGDLMLYGSDCLVLFYETFSSSYRYTRLGRIDDPTGLAAALGRGSVEVIFRAN